jgi:Fe-Mn family superoxide dismutase
MKENSGVKPTGQLFEAITKTFSSFDEFKTQFSEAGISRSGSGWTWLCISDKDRLFIYSSGNDNNPIIDLAETVGIPLITLDTWNQSYLRNQNRRSDYIDTFWNVLDWNEISRRYENAIKLLSMNNISEDVTVNVMETTTH